MSSEIPPRRRRWSRWRRRAQIVARRANFFAVIEVVSVIAFLIMTATTWIALDAQAAKAQLMPSDLTAVLLIGTLVPAMAILVLLGRRMALRRAAGSIGGTGQMHVRLVFLFSLIAAIPCCWW